MEELILQLSKNLGLYVFKKEAYQRSGITNSMDEFAEDIIENDILDIVKKHLKVVSAASLANGIPGGAAVSIPVLVGSTWKMYYNINQRLGISFSENFLKSVASGIVSNLASNGVAAGASNLLSFSPGIGTIAASVGSVVINRTSIYTAAVAYLKILCSLAEKGDSFSESNIRLNLQIPDNYQLNDESDQSFDDSNDEECFDDRFEDELVLFFKKTLPDLIDQNIDSLTEFSNRCFEMAESCNSESIASEYCFMAAYACFMHYKCNSDKEALSLGWEMIGHSLYWIEDDDEYNLMKALLEIRLEPNETTLDSIKDSLPDIEQLQNNLLKKEFWKEEINDALSEAYYVIYKDLYEQKDGLGTAKYAECYELGKGVPVDTKKALALYQESLRFLKDEEDEDEDYEDYVSCVESKIKELAAMNTSNKEDLSETEKEYVELMNEFYEDDGAIDSRARTVLEKMRTRLGISESRAHELEKNRIEPLSEDEKEYLEAYKDAASDGTISEKDRRFLDRLRKASGITEERASKIEKMV